MYVKGCYDTTPGELCMPKIVNCFKTAVHKLHKLDCQEYSHKYSNPWIQMFQLILLSHIRGVTELLCMWIFEYGLVGGTHVYRTKNCFLPENMQHFHSTTVKSETERNPSYH